MSGQGTPPFRFKRLCENFRWEFCVEVEGFIIERIADNSEPSFFYHSTFNGFQPIEAAGHALVALLRKKHDQLDVDDHRRFLIAVNEGCRALADDVVAGCAFIDFGQYPNFDRIYFEESPGSFRLVYDREAWLAMEIGKLPDDIMAKSLVTRWLEVRLGHWQDALDTVLQICWDRHSTEWLSQEGRQHLNWKFNYTSSSARGIRQSNCGNCFMGPHQSFWIADAKRMRFMLLQECAERGRACNKFG